MLFHWAVIRVSGAFAPLKHFLRLKSLPLKSNADPEIYAGDLIDDGESSLLSIHNYCSKGDPDHTLEIRNMELYCQLLQDIAKASDSIMLTPYSDPFTDLF